MKKLVVGQFLLILALMAAVFAPHAQADPVPGFVSDLVCPTLDNDPSVYGVRRMMQRDTTLLFNAQNAWDTILQTTLDRCPQHLGVLKQYADFYGGH